jgi:hypothetical protein
VRNDEQLNAGVTIASGGVLPNLHLALLKKGCYVEHRRITWCHCRESGPLVL